MPPTRKKVKKRAGTKEQQISQLLPKPSSKPVEVKREIGYKATQRELILTPLQVQCLLMTHPVLEDQLNNARLRVEYIWAQPAVDDQITGVKLTWHEDESYVPDAGATYAEVVAEQKRLDAEANQQRLIDDKLVECPTCEKDVSIELPEGAPQVFRCPSCRTQFGPDWVEPPEEDEDFDDFEDE